MDAHNRRVLYLCPGSLSARGPGELERRLGVLRSWAAPGVEVGIAENANGPASIESAYEEYLSVPGTFEIARAAEADGYDAIVLGCFGDPGLDGLREIVSVPVVGPCEAAMHVACTLGHRFGIVTVLDAVVGPLWRLVRIAGSSRAPRRSWPATCRCSSSGPTATPPCSAGVARHSTAARTRSPSAA